MTYNEFMNWVQTDEELKEKFDRLLGERITKDGVTRILQFYNIYPDEYTNAPFVHGCYKDNAGNWYYYNNYDERTSLTPNGTRASEDECFNHLKNSLLVEIQHHEEEKRAEAERIANLTPEQKAEREREAKLLCDFHLVENMFSTEKVYGLHGSEYDPGDFSFINYEKTALVKHFLDSYYYYSVGDYYGEGEPIEEIADNYTEIFWEVIVNTINRLKVERKVYICIEWCRQCVHIKK